MKPVVIFGTGEFAECIHFYLVNDSQYKIVAFTADRDCIKESVFKNLPVVPFDSITTDFPPDRFDMFIAIGYQNLNSLRTGKFIEAKRKGYNLISYISSKNSFWHDLKIGENCFIMENNVIHPFVVIDNNVIIWSSNLISHGTHVSKNCFITSHVVIGGEVLIGENCFFGINSSIRDHIKVAPNCIIGANAVILRDTRENGIYITKSTEMSRIPHSMLKKV